MGLKVAIIGLAPSTHADAPWDDPTWEKWGLPWDSTGYGFMKRHFEMHDQRLLDSEHCKRGPDYAQLDWLVNVLPCVTAAQRLW